MTTISTSGAGAIRYFGFGLFSKDPVQVWVGPQKVEDIPEGPVPATSFGFNFSDGGPPEITFNGTFTFVDRKLIVAGATLGNITVTTPGGGAIFTGFTQSLVEILAASGSEEAFFGNLLRIARPLYWHIDFQCVFKHDAGQH